METNSGVVWLIDAAYVLNGHVGKIDYDMLKKTFQQWACKGKDFDQIIFYNSTVGDNRADAFHAALEKLGFRIKLFPLKRSNGKMVQRGVDVAICVDLLRLAYEGKFWRVVLTAGDGDLIEAVKLVRSRYQEVMLTGYRDSMSNDLLAAASQVYWMGEK